MNQKDLKRQKSIRFADILDIKGEEEEGVRVFGFSSWTDSEAICRERNTKGGIPLKMFSVRCL